MTVADDLNFGGTLPAWSALQGPATSPYYPATPNSARFSTPNLAQYCPALPYGFVFYMASFLAGGRVFSNRAVAAQGVELVINDTTGLWAMFKDDLIITIPFGANGLNATTPRWYRIIVGVDGFIYVWFSDSNPRTPLQSINWNGGARPGSQLLQSPGKYASLAPPTFDVASQFTLGNTATFTVSLGGFMPRFYMLGNNLEPVLEFNGLQPCPILRAPSGAVWTPTNVQWMIL